GERVEEARAEREHVLDADERGARRLGGEARRRPRVEARAHALGERLRLEPEEEPRLRRRALDLGRDHLRAPCLERPRDRAPDVALPRPPLRQHDSTALRFAPRVIWWLASLASSNDVGGLGNASHSPDPLLDELRDRPR